MATRPRAVDDARRLANERRYRFARVDRQFNRPRDMTRGDVRSATDQLVQQFLVDGGQIVRIDPT